MTALTWQWLGRVAYEPTVALLERQREAVLGGDVGAERVFLCEHDPVITVGRSGDMANVLMDGVPVVRTNRGGDVTYHGPGQLMVYPVVKLRRGVVSFLESVSAALARTLAHYGVSGAAWQRDPAGLWLDGAKIAACGIHLRRSVTLHGFALNVSTPADAWQRIVPCGIPGGRVTSLAEHSGGVVPAVGDVARVAAPLLSDALSPASARVVGNGPAPAI